MVKEIKYIEFSEDEIYTNLEEMQKNLEEMLRSGWAVLLASNENIFTLMNAVKPGDFKMFMLLGAKSEKILKVVYLVKVAAIMDGDDPDRDETCALICHSIKKLGKGLEELEYTPLPVLDELVGEFVKMVLEKGC